MTNPLIALGSLGESDDYTHEAGPESNFNESMYFNFFSHSPVSGGFMRIGNRPNERYAEVTLCLYEPDGAVLFNYLRPEISSNSVFDAGGMRFDTEQPFIRLRTTFRGEVLHLTEPSGMVDPSKAFKTNPRTTVAIDLTHEAVAPAYGSSGQGLQVDSENGFATAHYEQHMRVSGIIERGGQRMEFDGYGLRDHSWGPRYWQALHSYRWLTCSFGPDLNIAISETVPAPGQRIQRGVVIRDGQLTKVKAIAIETQFAGGNRHQTAMTARLGLEGGEQITLHGRVKSFIPLRNRRAGMATYLGEGMTEYSCLGRTGVGISEYLDQD